MAKAYGLEAFCYYHYWFAGRQVLERPLEEIVKTKDPDFGFCVCWANQTWSGIWHGLSNKILIEQTYPGFEDHKRHFETLLPVFSDPRHILVDGKPVWLIYRPKEIPDTRNTLDLWRNFAIQAGLKGLHIIGVTEDRNWDPYSSGFDGAVSVNFPARRSWVSKRQFSKWLKQEMAVRRGHPTIYQYKDVVDNFVPDQLTKGHLPCVVPNWDNSPRSGSNALVLQDSTPELFRGSMRKALDITKDAAPEHRMVFLKSWNEWAEGNYVEPDLRYGHAYLEVIREEILRATN